MFFDGMLLYLDVERDDGDKPETLSPWARDWEKRQLKRFELLEELWDPTFECHLCTGWIEPPPYSGKRRKVARRHTH